VEKMKVKILQCTKCREYSLKRKCVKCGADCLSNKPARYSPEDRWGKYRRMAKGL